MTSLVRLEFLDVLSIVNHQIS